MLENRPGEYDSAIWRNDFLRQHPFLHGYIDDYMSRETLVALGGLRERAIKVGGSDFSMRNEAKSPFIMATTVFTKEGLSHDKLNELEHHLEAVVLAGLECGPESEAFTVDILEQINKRLRFWNQDQLAEIYTRSQEKVFLRVINDLLREGAMLRVIEEEKQKKVNRPTSTPMDLNIFMGRKNFRHYVVREGEDY